MTQDQKTDAIYKMVTELSGDMKAYKVTQDTHREGILSIASQLEKTKEVTDGLVANQNKVIGATWVVGGTGILAGLGSMILHLYDKYK
jgi:hypothetical protein